MKTVRSSEWWDFKFTSILATIYATSILQQIAFAELISFFFFLILALTPGASYVSLLNDLTDLEEDRRAGKENRLEGKSKIYALSLLSACIFAGLTVCLFLSALTLCFYLCAWVAFTLYSLPPVRLKKRGIFGVIADASGSHVFPQMFAISALTDWYDKEIDFFWLALVMIWSFFSGLRGILWHQLKDKNNDRVSGVKTFAERHEDSFVRNLARWVVFPAEITAFLFMLGYARNDLGFIFLAFNILIDLLRYFVWGVRILIVGSGGRYRILMNEFYSIFYPLSFLLMGLDHFYSSWFILLLHILLFFRGIYDLCVELVRLIVHSFRAFRGFVAGY